MGYAVTLSLAKSFAITHDYVICSMQEAIAIGTANALGSLFGAIPATSSLARSSCQVVKLINNIIYFILYKLYIFLCQESSGGKTQVASVISAILVLLCLGPFSKISRRFTIKKLAVLKF